MPDRVTRINLRPLGRSAIFGRFSTMRHPRQQQFSVVRETGRLRFDRPEEVSPEVHDEIAERANRIFSVLTWDEVHS